MGRKASIGGDLIRGAIAGAVATWVMDRATTLLYGLESGEARRTEDEARGDRTAYEATAEKVTEAAGVELGETGRAGTGLHWATGIAGGAAYAVLRGRVPLVGKGDGVGFGSTFFLFVDEGLGVLLGAVPGPSKFPWQTHARGLAGHVVFGTVTDATLGLLEMIG